MKKINNVDIDAYSIINSFRQETPPMPPSVSPPVSRPKKEKETEISHKETLVETRIKKKGVQSKELNSEHKFKEDEYKALFIHESSVAANKGKQVYVRDEYHNRILQMAQTFGNKLTLFSFIDNILTHHFEQNEELLRQMYRKHYKDLF